MDDNERQNDANIVIAHHGFTLVPIFDDYAYRWEGLKDYCLYDYYSMFYKRNRQGGISFTSQHPQHQSYRQFIRDPAIPALLGKIFTIKPNSTGEKDLEEYFCILSGLFVPWSNHHPFKPSFMTNNNKPGRNVDLRSTDQSQGSISATMERTTSL